MNGIVEKNYSEALFSLVSEERRDSLPEVNSELEQLDAVLKANPELVKLSTTPTVSREEKLDVIRAAFEGRVSTYVLNFLLLITENGRLPYFHGMYRHFRESYNEAFNLADITVVTTVPLSEETRSKITAKMEAVTGKKITLAEEIDKSIVGGIVVKYGNTSFDGSVKTKLEQLKKDIANVIC